MAVPSQQKLFTVMKEFVSWKYFSLPFALKIISCKWPQRFSHFAQLESNPSFITLRWRVKFTSVDTDLVIIVYKDMYLVLVRWWGRRQRGGGDKDKEMNEWWSLPSRMIANIYWMHPMHQSLFWAHKNPLLNSVVLYIGTIWISIIQTRKLRPTEIEYLLLFLIFLDWLIFLTSCVWSAPGLSLWASFWSRLTSLMISFSFMALDTSSMFNRQLRLMS